MSRPFLRCDIGVRSRIQLCRGCGREKERQRLIRLERFAIFLQIKTQWNKNNNYLLWAVDEKG